jgi:hypothetical protein
MHLISLLKIEEIYSSPLKILLLSNIYPTAQSTYHLQTSADDLLVQQFEWREYSPCMQVNSCHH